MLTPAQIAASLKENYGSIPRSEFSEDQLPDEVRELINAAYSAGYEAGLDDGAYEG